MSGKADIMGLSIDIVEKKELQGEMKQYLQNEYLNVIFFVTLQMIERSAAQPEYKELLENSDYLLPAEELVLSICEQQVPEGEDVFRDFFCFKEIADSFGEEEQHLAENIYYIGKTKEETQLLVDYSSECYPWLKAQGMYCEGMEDKDDLLVNEINAVSPDILVVALESPFQEEWVLKNSTKLNARLCIGMGNLLTDFLKKKKNGNGVQISEKWNDFLKKLYLKHLKKRQNNIKKQKK